MAFFLKNRGPVRNAFRQEHAQDQTQAKPRQPTHTKRLPKERKPNQTNQQHHTSNLPNQTKPIKPNLPTAAHQHSPTQTKPNKTKPTKSSTPKSSQTEPNQTTPNQTKPTNHPTSHPTNQPNQSRSALPATSTHADTPAHKATKPGFKKRPNFAH